MNTKDYSPVLQDAVRIEDSFWSSYQKLIREVVLPYQWEVLNDRIPDAEQSHAIENLRIAAGLQDGDFKGYFFQDSDVAKWLEAVAYCLYANPNAEMEAIADSAIELIGKAQQPDGYLNSYFTISAKGKRWTNLYECHELYVAGHFIEAGVAWFQATGKRNLLDIVCRLADCIDKTFGPEEGKLKAYDGHQEIELALVRLYDVTGRQQYLNLARFFLEERGKEPYYFTTEWEKRGRISAWTGHISDNPARNKEYLQAHLPVKEQKVAVGHAVRLVYMLTGMASVAIKAGDTAMLNACRTLWCDIILKQMYITGGIGATHIGEAFTFDYDLPNDTTYAETCASVGLVFFAQKMLEIENLREYADVIEQALFNVIVGSINKDGKHYFYVNPLEVWPEASEKNPDRQHIKGVRQKWFGCACCPPNLSRLLASLGKYIYTKDEETLYIHQFIGSEVTVGTSNGRFKIKQITDYPWHGSIMFTISVETSRTHTLAIRVPGWCTNATLAVNRDKPVSALPGEDGYARITRTWMDGDTVQFVMDMPAVLMEANPLVRSDAGMVAIQRGPIVYCLEEVDNGANLSALSIPANAALNVQWDTSVLGGTWVIRGDGLREGKANWGKGLYRTICKEQMPVQFTAIPYSLWGNRLLGEMIVWVRKG